MNRDRIIRRAIGQRPGLFEDRRAGGRYIGFRCGPVEQGARAWAVGFRRQAEGAVEFLRREQGRGIDRAEFRRGQRARQNGPLRRDQTHLLRHVRAQGDGPQHARIRRRQNLPAGHETEGTHHGEMQSAGFRAHSRHAVGRILGRDRRIGLLGEQAPGQMREERIGLEQALFGHDRKGQIRARHVSGQDLAIERRLVPPLPGTKLRIGGHGLAGTCEIAGQQTPFQPRRGDRRIVAPGGAMGQQGIETGEIAQGHQPADAQGKQAFLALRPLGRASRRQQQAPHHVAHRGRRGRRRQADQQRLDEGAVRAGPHIAAQPAIAVIEGAG